MLKKGISRKKVEKRTKKDLTGKRGIDIITW
jgi:hypothetical protein